MCAGTTVMSTPARFAVESATAAMLAGIVAFEIPLLAHCCGFAGNQGDSVGYFLITLALYGLNLPLLLAMWSALFVIGYAIYAITQKSSPGVIFFFPAIAMALSVTVYVGLREATAIELELNPLLGSLLVGNVPVMLAATRAFCDLRRTAVPRSDASERA